MVPAIVIYLFVLLSLQGGNGAKVEKHGFISHAGKAPLFIIEDPPRVEYASSDDFLVLSLPLNPGHEEVTCHIRNPSGQVYQLRPVLEDSTAKFEVLEESRDCSAKFGPISDKHAGDWLMWSINADSLNNIYERRRPFEVRLLDAPRSEQVQLPSDITASNSIVSAKVTRQPAYVIAEEEVIMSIATGEVAEVTLTIRDGHFLQECFIQRSSEDPISQNANTREDVTFVSDFENGCKVLIGPISDANAGRWTPIAWVLDSIGTLYEVRMPRVVRNFDVVIPKVNSRVLRDLTNTARNYEVVEDVDETIPLVIEETEEILIAEGSRVLMSVPQTYYHAVTGCYVQTNEGKIIELKPESNNTDSNIDLQPGSFQTDCRVQIKNLDENSVGNWIIYTLNYDQNGGYYERRKGYILKLNETEDIGDNTEDYDGNHDGIDVDDNSQDNEITDGENVNEPDDYDTVESDGELGVLPSDKIKVYSGQDLYIRLNRSLNNIISCDLKDSRGEVLNFEDDSRYPKSCGLVVHDLKSEDSGVWSLSVETPDYAFTANVDVEIMDFQPSETSLQFKLGTPVSVDFGPEDAAYCRVQNPAGVETFSGFSRCSIQLERAKLEDGGTWKVTLGLPGSLKALNIDYEVEVFESEPSQQLQAMNTSVSIFQDYRQLTCNLTSEETLKTCKFTRPDAAIFLLTEGLGDGRYTTHQAKNIITEDGNNGIACSIFVRSPQEEDFGTWTCSVETSDSLSSGFLTLAATADVENGNVDTTPEPILREISPNITAIKEASVTLQCRINTKIEYCWFRSQNGTIFSVGPGTASVDGNEYAGSGLDSGDCAMRINRVRSHDTGLWTCNVGIRGKMDHSTPIHLNVIDSPLIVKHDYDQHSGVLVVTGTTYDGSPLSTCRLVSPKGVGLSTHTVDSKMSFTTSQLSRGVCQMTLVGYTLSDVGTWSVIARRLGEESEITANTFFYPFNGTHYYEKVALLCLMLLVITIMAVLLVTVFINSSAKSWASERAAYLRSSFRLNNPKTLEAPPPPYTQA